MFNTGTLAETIELQNGDADGGEELDRVRGERLIRTPVVDPFRRRQAQFGSREPRCVDVVFEDLVVGAHQCVRLRNVGASEVMRRTLVQLAYCEHRDAHRVVKVLHE